MFPDQSTVRNRLLALMAPQDFAVLAPLLTRLDMPRRFVLCEPQEPIADVFFVETGIGSIVAISREGLEAEAGLFGRDGVSPIEAVLGVERSPHRIFMQVGGDGWRTSAKALAAVLETRPSLRSLLLRYAQSLMQQVAYTALSNGVHQIEARLARWLLMCDDRTDGGELQLTHEYIAIMLAVRRPSVTTALHVLEGNHLIRLERKRIQIRDRAGLEAFAGDSYGKPEAEYEHSVGPLREPPNRA